MSHLLRQDPSIIVAQSRLSIPDTRSSLRKDRSRSGFKSGAAEPSPGTRTPGHSPNRRSPSGTNLRLSASRFFLLMPATPCRNARSVDVLKGGPGRFVAPVPEMRISTPRRPQRCSKHCPDGYILSEQAARQPADCSALT